MSDRPPREAPVSVRLPEELRNWIADQAAREERSFSAQIVWLLERGREHVYEYLTFSSAASAKAARDAPPRDAQPPPVTPPAPTNADAEDRSVRGRTFEKPFQTDFKEPAKKERRR